MSYMKDLDEYTDEELNNELRRRLDLREVGLCDYCNRDGTTIPCKFPKRHKIAERFIEKQKMLGVK